MSNENMNIEKAKPKSGEAGFREAAGSQFDWEEREPGQISGFLKSDPGTTLFLIEVNKGKPHRGRLFGAFIPDAEEGFEGLIIGLKGHIAPSFMNDWLRKFLTANVKSEEPSDGHE